MSPYMLGVYYKPQLTSMLSIAFRLAGVFLTVVATPLVLWWLVALAMGPETFATVHAFTGSIIGNTILLISLFLVCYHFMNGIRHMIWDTAHLLELDNVYRSGYVMVAASLAMFLLTWWAAS